MQTKGQGEMKKLSRGKGVEESLPPVSSVNDGKTYCIRI